MTQLAGSRRGKQGTLVGRYRVGALIGSGTTARVYKGVHTRLGYPVAIKFLHDYLASDAIVARRFVDESTTAARTRAPGVVDVLDYGRDESGSFYIAMEFIEGETLASTVERGACTVQDVVEVGTQIAITMAAVHEAGIVHRDLKPDNVVLQRDSTRANGYIARVLDLGLAKRPPRDGEPALTKAGSQLGTPLYMAPEQGIDARSADARSDIYALGCILFHMITGSPPFKGSAVDVTLAHRHAPVPSAHSHRRGIDDRFAVLLEQMMRKQPDARPQSMLEVARGLQLLVGNAASAAGLVPPRQPRATRNDDSSMVTSPRQVPAVLPQQATPAQAPATNAPVRDSAATMLDQLSVAARLSPALWDDQDTYKRRTIKRRLTTVLREPSPQRSVLFGTFACSVVVALWAVAFSM